MKMQYKIVSITHNGRKDVRGTPVEDAKYHYLCGATAIFDLADMKQFHSMNWDIVNHPYYRFWTTSEVLEAGILPNGLLQIETANTIYELEEVGKVEVLSRPRMSEMMAFRG